MTIDALPNRRAIWNPDAPLASGVDGGHTLSYQMLEAKGATLLGKLTGASDGRIVLDAKVNDYHAFGDEASANFKTTIDAFIERTGLEAPPPEIDPNDLPDEHAGQREVFGDPDLAAAGATTVIWTIGFTHDFSWLELPIFDQERHPVHTRGVTEAPDAFFLGLHCLHTLSSGLIYGVGHDAAYIANQIERHLGYASVLDGVQID